MFVHHTTMDAMAKHLFTALCALLALSGTFAQDFDIHLQGVISDATTGQPIPFAKLEVTDQFDPEFLAPGQADVKGRYQRELYSGWTHRGGLYLVEFGADGYQSRMALLDVSEVNKGKEESLAWRITMDVGLVPLSSRVGPTGPMLGVCTWNKSARTLRWTEPAAAKVFTVERYIEPRILAHRAKVDSVNRLSGLMVDGVVRDHWTEAPLQGVEVRVSVLEGEATRDTVYRTDDLGYYAMRIPYEGTYRLEYVRQDLVSKQVLVDPRGVPEEERRTGHRAMVDIRLFADIPGEDLAFLQDPMGRMSYSIESRNMQWDMGMSRPILERLNAILDRHAPEQKVVPASRKK